MGAYLLSSKIKKANFEDDILLRDPGESGLFQLEGEHVRDPRALSSCG